MEASKVSASSSNDKETLDSSMAQLCNSKAEEFQMLGYTQVTGEDIWACVSERYEKNGFPRVHRIVNDIYSLKATDLMNWMTIGAYKGNMRF